MPTVLPFNYPDTSCLAPLTYAEQIILNSIVPPPSHLFSMPPHLPTGTPRVPHLSLSSMVTTWSRPHLSLTTILLSLVVLAACLRCAVAYCSRRKRRTTGTRQTVPEKEEKETQPCVDNSPPPPELRPVYPWIGPPRPLPGPYDPRLYPLPTIRRHSYPEPTQESPEELNTVAYTRRVSTNGAAIRHTTVRGAVTTTTTVPLGWRRNHWVVEGG
jgi:hypothetical protein